MIGLLINELRARAAPTVKGRHTEMIDEAADALEAQAKEIEAKELFNQETCLLLTRARLEARDHAEEIATKEAVIQEACALMDKAKAEIIANRAETEALKVNVEHLTRISGKLLVENGELRTQVKDAYREGAEEFSISGVDLAQLWQESTARKNLEGGE